MTLICEHCTEKFERPGRHGPVPRFCSVRCRARWDRATRTEYLRAYSRERMRRLRRSGARREYEAAYYQRPEVRERYRLRWRDLYGDPHPDVVIPAPYTGHRWLDMARAAVGADFDGSQPWADDYHDEMGEAVLALLEGRDMKQAIVDYRKAEYVPRHLTLHDEGDWADEDGYDRWFDSVLPAAPSAEDSFFATLPNMEVQAKFHHGSSRRPYGNNKGRQEPAQRRRRRDAGWRAHAVV